MIPLNELDAIKLDQANAGNSLGQELDTLIATATDANTHIIHVSDLEKYMSKYDWLHDYPDIDPIIFQNAIQKLPFTHCA